MLNPFIEVRGVSLRRAGAPVIDRLDWRAQSGAIVWVVGENGSGKSTLLSILAGRTRPDAGEVRIEPPGREGVVWYTPRMAPPPESLVRDWHRLIEELTPPGQAPSLRPDVRPTQRLGDVSTGEQKRMLLEALLRRDASAYLMDEPFEHLSPNAKSLLMDRLRQRARASLVIVAIASFSIGLALRPGWLDLRGATSLYGYVYLVALALVFRFDLAHDIDRGFADFMAPNLIMTRTYVAARLVAGLVALLQFALIAALLTMLAPRIDARFAAWTGAFWLLLAIVLAPAVALAESGLRTRLPVLAVALFTIIAIVATAGFGSASIVPGVLGTQGVTYAVFSSLDGMLWRAAVVGVGGLSLVLPLLEWHWAAR